MGLSPPFPHRCLLRDDEKLTDILGFFFGFVKCLFFSWTGMRIATAGACTGFAMTGYKACGRTGRRGRRPLRTGTRCAVERATARVAPTEGYKQYRGRADVVGIGPYALFTDRIL